MSSWLAAYQRAVDNATSQSKNLREYIAEKHASLGTLEEAGRQLRETVSSVTTTVAQTAQRATSSATATVQTASNARNELMKREMAREMVEYGITDEYVEAVRSKLEYGIFRDHQLDDRANSGPGGLDDDGKRLRLNAWQERHVILLLQRVKEVDALRFTLCPKYMDDGVFWAIYFELVRKMLPDEAYEDVEGGELKLPRRYEEVVEERARKNTGGLEFLESRLREMRAIGGRVMGDRLRGGDVSEYITSAATEGKQSARKGQSAENAEEKGKERGAEGRPGATALASIGGDVATTLLARKDNDDNDDLNYVMDGNEYGEGEALDDDELDAYLDTLALSDSDDAAKDVVADDDGND